MRGDRLVSPSGDSTKHPRQREQAPPSPRSGSRFRLLALLSVAIGILLALLLGEIVIRLVEPVADTPGMPLANRGRIYGYAPNSTGYAGGVGFRVNGAGFRSPDFASIDPKQDFVVLVLGDSYAFGYGVDSVSMFPRVLEARLQQAYPDRRVRVANLGIPGYESSQELATLKEWQTRLRPRLVLLQYHLNDIQRYPGDSSAGSGHRPGAILGFLEMAKAHVHLLRLLLPRLASAARALNWTTETTVTAEIDEYLRNEPAWRENQRVLRDLFQVARDSGARVGVLVVPYIVALDERHPPLPAYETVVRFCEQEGVPTVNAFDTLKGHDAGAMWINAFDGHPNALGHALIADAAMGLVTATGIFEAK